MDDKSGTNQGKIYLYSHSPGAEKLIESGEAAISTGGIRRSDGTIMEMAKPLSFTLDELKEMVGSEKQLSETDKKVQQLSAKLGLSEQGMKELSRIGWLNNAAIGQVYSLTYAGFKQTLAGIEYIANHMTEFSQYVRQRDLGEIKEKTNKFIAYLEADERKLDLMNFDVTSSNVDEHLNDIVAFIEHMYEGLMNNTVDGFLACSIIEALIVPFFIVVMKYCIRFFYDNRVPAGSSAKWLGLILSITESRRFRGKLQYYVHLETELSYQDKVLLGKYRSKRIAAIPKAIDFEADYTLYHNKEEYLGRGKALQKRISTPKLIPADGKIYL